MRTDGMMNYTSMKSLINKCPASPGEDGGGQRTHMVPWLQGDSVGIVM